MAIVVISGCFAPILLDSCSSTTITLFSIVVFFIVLVITIKIITNLSNAGEYLVEVVNEIPQKSDVVVGSKPVNIQTATQIKEKPKNGDTWLDEFV